MPFSINDSDGLQPKSAGNIQPITKPNHGQTIPVRDDRRRAYSALGHRLPGIEATVRQAAKQFNADQAFGQTVTVRVRDVDWYTPTVAEVILPDGWNLNQEQSERLSRREFNVLYQSSLANSFRVSLPRNILQ